MKRPLPTTMPLPPLNKRRRLGGILRLPWLTAEEAWALATILEQLQQAIWRVHGDAMAEYQGAVFPDHPAPACARPVCDPEGTRRKAHTKGQGLDAMRQMPGASMDMPF